MDKGTEDLEYLIQLLIDDQKVVSDNVSDDLSDIKNYLKQIDTNTMNASKLVLQSPPSDLNAYIEYKDLSSNISILVSRLDELNQLLLSSKDVNIGIGVDIETKIDKDTIKSDLNTILSDLNTVVDIKPNIDIDFLKEELNRLTNLPEIKMDVKFKPIYDGVDEILQKLQTSTDLNIKINPKLNPIDLQKEIDDFLSKSSELNTNIKLKLDTLLEPTTFDNVKKNIDSIINDIQSNIKPIDIDTNLKLNSNLNNDINKLISETNTSLNVDVKYQENTELNKIIAKLEEFKKTDLNFNITSNIEEIKKELSNIKISIPDINLDPVNIKGIIKPILDPEFKTPILNLDSKIITPEFNIDKKNIIKSIETALDEHTFNISVDPDINFKTINKIEKKDTELLTPNLTVNNNTNVENKEILKALETNNKLLLDLINLQKMSKNDIGKEKELINTTKETIISNTTKETTKDDNSGADDIKSILSDILNSNQDIASTMKRNSFKNNSDILTL